MSSRGTGRCEMLLGERVCVCVWKKGRGILRARKKPQTGAEVQVCGEQGTSGGELRG